MNIIKKFSQDSINLKNAFTLIELLVSVSIFVIFTLAIMSIYFSSIERHTVALQIQTVNEELRYAIEVMTRDIKAGYLMASKDNNSDGNIDQIYIYHPTKNINSNNCKISGVTVGVTGCLQYKFNTVDKRIEVQGNGDSTFVPLTSSNIIVWKMNFYIDDIVGSTSEQPKVTILINAREKKDFKDQSKIFLQTTVNQKETVNLYQGLLP